MFSLHVEIVFIMNKHLQLFAGVAPMARRIAEATGG